MVPVYVSIKAVLSVPRGQLASVSLMEEDGDALSKVAIRGRGISFSVQLMAVENDVSMMVAPSQPWGDLSYAQRMVVEDVAVSRVVTSLLSHRPNSV